MERNNASETALELLMLNPCSIRVSSVAEKIRQGEP